MSRSGAARAGGRPPLPRRDHGAPAQAGEGLAFSARPSNISHRFQADEGSHRDAAKAAHWAEGPSQARLNPR